MALELVKIPSRNVQLIAMFFTTTAVGNKEPTQGTLHSNDLHLWIFKVESDLLLWPIIRLQWRKRAHIMQSLNTLIICFNSPVNLTLNLPKPKTNLDRNGFCFFVFEKAS